MNPSSPPRRFEASLDQALLVWCFERHYSESAKNAAAMILMGASEWSPVAEDSIMRTLVDEGWFGWSGSERFFWEHLMKHWRDTPLAQTWIRAHHLATWGEDGSQTVGVFRLLRKHGLWSRSSWETVRRAAWWNFTAARYTWPGKDFREYALREIEAWGKDADPFPRETELKAAYWVWEREMSAMVHFYVPEGAALSDYSTEWDLENFQASWPPPKQKRKPDTRSHPDEAGWEKCSDWEWEEMVWEYSDHPALSPDMDGNSPAMLAARNPQQREFLLACFSEDLPDHREILRKLRTYFDLIDARFQPERTEAYRRLLMESGSLHTDYPPHSRNRALQLVLWWSEHPETKPFLTGQVNTCEAQTDYAKKCFAAECLVWLVLRWPEDEAVRRMVRETVGHPCLELAETAAELLRFCHSAEADYLPILQEQRHRSAIFFREYLMAASPDLEAMQLALQTLALLKETYDARDLSKCGASILVQTYGPRKDLLARLRDIARDSASLNLQTNIAEVLQLWLPLSFGTGRAAGIG
jgi:hypothetical protein